MAISGEIPRRPLSSIDSVFRETARPFAASVTVSPSGSRHWRRMNVPGWGESCMSIDYALWRLATCSEVSAWSVAVP